MRLISPFLKHAVYPSLSRLGYLRRAAPSGVAVVTYHGVLPARYDVVDSMLDGNLISPEAFRQQLGLLKKHYHVIRPEQFLLWCEAKLDLPARAVLLTCDDCLQNTLTEMLPILLGMDLSCLFFATGASLSQKPEVSWYDQLFLMFLSVPGDFSLGVEEIGLPRRTIGRAERHSLWWNIVKKLSAVDITTRSRILEGMRCQLPRPDVWNPAVSMNSAKCDRFLLLNESGLRQLVSAGMSIGAHTLSHPVLSMATPELAWTEISESRVCLEQALGIRVWALAYPFGGRSTVTAREFELAAAAGFQCAFLNVDGGFGSETPRFAVPRVHVSASMGLTEFEAHVSGFYRRMRRLFGRTDEAAGFIDAARQRETQESAV